MAATPDSDLQVMFLGAVYGCLDMRGIQWCYDNERFWCGWRRKPWVLYGEIQDGGIRRVVLSEDNGGGVRELLREALKKTFMFIGRSCPQKRENEKDNEKKT